MNTKHEQIGKIIVTNDYGYLKEYKVPAGATVTLEPVGSTGRVYVDFDTDDDFALRLNDRVMYYDTLYFESVEEAVRALQSIAVVNAAEWSQAGNTFTRKTESHPTKHWFYEWINEAVGALQNGETSFVRSGNQTLQVSVY